MLLSVVALVPIIWLIIALAVLKLPGHWACFSALLVAAVLSLTLWQMPATDCATSALGGVCRRLVAHHPGYRGRHLHLQPDPQNRGYGCNQGDAHRACLPTAGYSPC